jgi:hypothetical protein
VERKKMRDVNVKERERCEMRVKGLERKKRECGEEERNI